MNARVRLTPRGQRRLEKKSSKWRSWTGLLELFAARCAYCGAVGALTRDHIWPKSRGGGGMEVGNVVPACVTCNSEKGQRTALEYYLWLKSEGRTPRFRMPECRWRQASAPSIQHLLGRTT